MNATRAESLTLAIDETREVSALWQSPAQPIACYVLAHGAGAGMAHPFMATVAKELANRGIATLRYQFPYMEQRSRRPDPPALCHATVRAAVAEAARCGPELPLFAGGRSFGGRMTSQAQAATPLAGVRALAFLAFPLHPPQRPARDRAEHLYDVKVPMLFIQGTRDDLASLDLLRPLIAELGLATLKVLEDADHSWHVPARSGRKDQDVIGEALDALAAWIQALTRPT